MKKSSTDRWNPTERTLQVEQRVRQLVDRVVGALGGGEDAKKLMMGTAATESHYGQNPRTYRSGYHGGLFQVDRNAFRATQDVRSHPRRLPQHHATIKKEFDIDWPSVTWEQLRDPKYSAIAARLHYLTKEAPIPNTREGRAQYWKDHYNSNSRRARGRPADYLRRSNPSFSMAPQPPAPAVPTGPTVPQAAVKYAGLLLSRLSEKSKSDNSVPIAYDLPEKRASAFSLSAMLHKGAAYFEEVGTSDAQVRQFVEALERESATIREQKCQQSAHSTSS